MRPTEFAAQRGVQEILHFTTKDGLLGALQTDAVLSRDRVQDNADVAYIFQAVWPPRAVEWTDYISLSLHRINRRLYRQAEAHVPDRWWAVLAFEPAILDHGDVWFATTNNIYPACRRAKGIAGLEALYADEVVGIYGERLRRDGLDSAQPTDRAAEVLYPGTLSLEHLRCAYVRTDDQRGVVLAWCDALDRAEVPVEVNEDVFS